MPLSVKGYHSLSPPLVWSLSSMASGWEIAGLFLSHGVVIKIQCESPTPSAMALHRWNPATTLSLFDIARSDWYSQIYLDILYNSELNVFECRGLSNTRNVHGEDKKMRGQSNVTLCECLINLRLNDLTWTDPERAVMFKYRRLSPCLSG